jgi:phage/plasmid-like protein (TIGR03299 family)
MNEQELITEKTQMLIKAGLNWKVNSEPIQTVSGILIPDRVALVREDTNKVLGIHTPNYSPYQNDELLELLYRISGQSGLQVHTGGSFRGGEKVWFQLKSNDLLLHNDKVEGYISGFNSFDGRTALGFGNASVTVSCQNTFYRGYKEVSSKLRHSSTMRPRIEEILRQIDVLLKEEQTQFAEIKRLGEVRMTNEVKDLITKRLFEISVEERLDNDELSTNLKNRLYRFRYDLGIETQQKDSTLWGLFSGVTRYTSHSMKQGKDNSEGKMFGKTGVIERKIYNELVEIAG